MAVVAGALGAILLLAVLADGRLLVADPDASAVTAADVRLARSLFSDATPPESLAAACIDADGTVEPACLGDGQPGPGGDTSTEVVPRACREAGSVSAACVERELGLDVPDACVRGDAIDVGCVAEAGDLLVLTDRCVEDDRLRVECLTGRVYGVPDPGPETGSDRPTFVPVPAAEGPPQRRPAPDPGDTEPPEQEDEDTGESGLGAIVGWLTRGVGLLVLLGGAGLVLAALVVAARRRGPGRGRPVEPDVDDDAHDRAVMAASLDAGARQLDLPGDPRLAIIAAYALLLDGLAACSQGRHPAETPLEHLERVLAALDVRPEPLRELTALFGEARFSDHAMTDVQRDRARDALAAAAADLDRVRAAVG